MQKYCPSCSEARDLERKRLWERAHPPSKKEILENAARVKNALRLNGERLSNEMARSITWAANETLSEELLWMVRICIPFTYTASKNHIYALVRRGHIALRGEVRGLRERIAVEVKRGLGNRKVAQNKVWIDILVQKSDNRGDAVNVIDTICDAVKVACGVDDKWFCIRRLDWEISKSEPKIFIGIGQTSCEEVQACSSCGRLLSFDKFWKSKSNKNGIGRNCISCYKRNRTEVSIEYRA